MDKTKFLEGLKEALQGEVSVAEINNQLLYYEKYIEDELRKGRTEEDILNELGAPRLIARTIIETKGQKTPYQNVYYEETEKKQNHQSAYQRKFRIKGILALVLGILVLLLILSAIFSIVSVLAPFVIPIIIIVLIVSYFQKR